MQNYHLLCLNHLKFNNDSAVHEVPKIKPSKWVNEIILLDNHRHESLDEILTQFLIL